MNKKDATALRQKLEDLELKIKLRTMEMDILLRMRQDLLNKLKPSVAEAGGVGQ